MSAGPRATIHLRVLGEVQRVPVEVPPTPAGMEDLLPAARAITNETIDAAIRQSAASGKPLTCCKGCGVCCNQLVPVTAPEARALKRVVEAMPPDRQMLIRERFAQTLSAVVAAGIMDPASTPGAPTWLVPGDLQGQDLYLNVAKRYFELQRPCAFLEDGACSIYEDRPLACREYIVSSPAAYCAALDRGPIEMIDPPLLLSHAIAEITTLVERKPAQQIPLFAALAWAELPGNAEAEPNVSGVELLKCLARWVDSKSDVPLAERAKG